MPLDDRDYIRGNHPPSCTCVECTNRRLRQLRKEAHPDYVSVCPRCGHKSLWHNVKENKYECLNLRCKAVMSRPDETPGSIKQPARSGNTESDGTIHYSNYVDSGVTGYRPATKQYKGTSKNLPGWVLALLLPFSLSVVGIAGVTSSGKTSFLLETAELNVLTQSLPVYYWYNEMSEAKMIYRCEDFPALIQAWKAGKFFPVMQSNFEFADVLQPDAINLVDYLDRDDDVFLIGGDIKKLYAPLNNGVVIFALQKKAHLDLGYGGNMSVKLSNLYIALDIKYQSGQSMHCSAKIVKCKDWKRIDTNPNSLCCEYHTGGKHGKLFLDGEWKPKKEGG